MDLYKIVLNSSSNDNGKVIGLIFLIIFILALYIGANIFLNNVRTTIKGKIGELKVSRKLKSISNGIVINNLTFRVNDKKTCQIDHILVCEKGIFVVETKNYIGRIYGDDVAREWTQVLNFGKVKNKLYSPVKQNITHVCELANRIGNNKYIFNCVVFANDNISYINSEYVFTKRGIVKYIKSLPTVYSQYDVEEIANNINNLNEEISNREHVRNIKNMKKDIDHNICPRCGSQLVLRNANDNKFYGCSNYPKCKFTKKCCLIIR